MTFGFQLIAVMNLPNIVDCSLFQSFADAIIALGRNHDVNYHSNFIEPLNRDRERLQPRKNITLVAVTFCGAKYQASVWCSTNKQGSFNFTVLHFLGVACYT